MRAARWRAAAALAAVALVASACALRASAQTDLVGGTDADQGYPFMASLQLSSGEHFCGAGLVAPDWLATAAHCVQGRALDGFTARIGSNDRTQGGEVRKPAEIAVHPDYDPDGAGGDLALVRLASPVEASPAGLGTDASVGTATRLLGWGQTCPTQGCGGSPVMLQQLDTSIVDGKGCTTAFNASVELCTGNPDGTKGACYGDSGGPELARAGERWLLVGVSSRPGTKDEKCGTGPSIYTSTVAYRQWIREHVPLEQEPPPSTAPTTTPTTPSPTTTPAPTTTTG